ncbi:alpha/beta fold hydrolase [Plastorhodobacter daqingensis]|uniref:Alpha/beta fold hydrolase n=1 Tax=Plastorhodobacter daqingensis TaxID=1387281 RepID=A0ABW2ULI6_9RHOB
MLLTGFSHVFLSGIGDIEAVVSDMVRRSNWQGVARQSELDLRVDVSGDLGAIKAETLVLGNLYDQMVDPAASRALARGITDAALAWIEGPHLALMETPEAVAEINATSPGRLNVRWHAAAVRQVDAAAALSRADDGRQGQGRSVIKAVLL